LSVCRRWLHCGNLPNKFAKLASGHHLGRKQAADMRNVLFAPRQAMGDNAIIRFNSGGPLRPAVREKRRRPVIDRLHKELFFPAESRYRTEVGVDFVSERLGVGLSG